MSDDSDGQRQCRRGVTVDVELDAAMALADMAGVGSAAPGAGHHQPPAAAHQPPAEDEDDEEDEEEELASTRLSLELGKVGIQSVAASPCSSAGHQQHPPTHHPHQPAAHHHHHQAHMPAPAAATGYGPRPRHMLTEAEKEAKRLRRVLANRESARQTILRRQAIRDELARKVADLSSHNENMKKEKDMVMQEYLSLKEANKQLKEQVERSRTTRTKAPSATAAMPIHVPAQQQQGAEAMAASPPATPPRPGFLYTAAPPAVPVPYVWGSWPPAAGYEHHHHHHGSPPGPAPICLPPPCAWYYPVVADPRGSPSHAYPHQAPAAFQQQQQQQQEPAGSGSPGAGGGATAEEDTDDDPCSLTLALDVDTRSAAPVGTAGPSDRDKATAARKRRKELTKLKHMHAAGRPGGDQW